MGIEPTTAAWEAAVLPLNYIRIIRGRFAPESGTRRCNDYFTTNAQKVNRFSENCREAPSRGADRTPLYPHSVYPCQQGDGGVTQPHEVSSSHFVRLRYFAGPEIRSVAVSASSAVPVGSTNPMSVLYFAANLGRGSADTRCALPAITPSLIGLWGWTRRFKRQNTLLRSVFEHAPPLFKAHLDTTGAYSLPTGDGGVTGMLAMTGLPRPRWQNGTLGFRSYIAANLGRGSSQPHEVSSARGARLRYSAGAPKSLYLSECEFVPVPNWLMGMDS